MQLSNVYKVHASRFLFLREVLLTGLMTTRIDFLLRLPNDDLPPSINMIALELS